MKSSEIVAFLLRLRCLRAVLPHLRTAVGHVETRSTQGLRLKARLLSSLGTLLQYAGAAGLRVLHRGTHRLYQGDAHLPQVVHGFGHLGVGDGHLGLRLQERLSRDLRRALGISMESHGISLFTSTERAPRASKGEIFFSDTEALAAILLAPSTAPSHRALWMTSHPSSI